MCLPLPFAHHSSRLCASLPQTAKFERVIEAFTLVVLRDLPDLAACLATARFIYEGSSVNPNKTLAEIGEDNDLWDETQIAAAIPNSEGKVKEYLELKVEVHIKQ